MKVVPQIIIFLVLIAIGWLAYDSHEPFRKLVDDIADITGISQELVRTQDEQAADRLALKDAERKSAEKAASSVAAAAKTSKPERSDQAPEIASSAVISQSAGQQPEAASPQDKIVWPTDVPPADVQLAKPVEMEEKTVKAPMVITDAEPEDQAEAGAQAVEHGSVPEPQLPVSSVTPAEPVNEPVQPSASEPEPAPVLSQPSPVIADGKEREPAEQDTAIEDRKNQALSGLAAARATWHQGNHDKAISMYLELMREFENHPDFAGELGNIYFSKGEIDMAIKAYSEAYVRLLKNNDQERAEQVLGIIYNLDQEQAAMLRDYFNR
jgi:tetratricopeptide (TPR) repeat protein